MTHDELLQAYFSERHLRPATKVSYQNAFNALNRAIPGSSAERLSREQLLAWRESSLSQGTLTSTSWNSYLRHLRAVLRFGLEQKRLQRTDNPFDGLFLPAQRRKKKTLQGEQVIAVIHEFNGLQRLEGSGQLSAEHAGRISPPWFWRTVFETLYHTGIRSNQLLHLRLNDVDLPEALLHIRMEGSKTHREYDIPINEALQPWLERLVRRARMLGMAEDEQLFNITRFKPGYWKHRQMTADHLSRAFTDLSKRLGFRVSPHRFRHTLGTSLMRNAKANLHLVKALLGHTNLSTTLQYIEPDMEGLRCLLNSRAAQERPDATNNLPLPF